MHCVRRVSDLAYRDFIETELPAHEYLGEQISSQLKYFPIVTREPFEQQERIPSLLSSGRLCQELGITPVDASSDRAMICGSMAMLADTELVLEKLGFSISPQQGVQGDFVIERAFVESEAPQPVIPPQVANG